MAFQFKNDFSKGINLDLDATRLPPNAAIFIKNLTDNINTNQSTPGGSGSNEYVRTPIEGTQALTISGMPAGTNYTVGFYSSEQTNEGYFAVYNSNGNHTVWVIRGADGSVVKVHQNTLLPFLLDPAHFYSDGRMTLELRSLIDPVTLQESNFKLLVFTNNNLQQCLIDVEASIATASYTTTYFTSSAAFYNRLELIHLGSALPIKCIKINDPNKYTPVPDDANKQNLLINEGWQFRIRTWDVWGRPSEWGIISSVYTPLEGGGCLSASNGLPRCANLCFDAGSPLIKYITVAYRRGAGNDVAGQVDTGWFETETFNKYDDSTGVEWYNRPINPSFTTSGSGMTFNAGANIITYTFCADKGSNPVDPEEAARTEPGLARFSSSVFSVNKTIGLANNAYGFQPISQSVTDAIEFSVKTADPANVPCPAAPLRTIIVYANLYRPWTDTSSLLRKSFDVYTFGDGGDTIAPDTVTCDVNNFALGQVFGDQDNPGFMMYLAGTPFKCIGTWGNLDPSTGIFTPQPIDTLGSFPGIKVTQFKIVDVPAGIYCGRMPSHHAKITDGNLQQTSTQVAGICPIGSALTPNARKIGIFSNPEKEIIIDCSAGDVNMNSLTDNMFVVLDLNNGVKSNGIDGYLYEQEGGAPVEMAVCYIHGSTMGTDGDAYGSFFTDHNGYYFVGSASSYCGIIILAPFCDGSIDHAVFDQTSGCGGSTGKMAHGDGKGKRSPDYYGNFGNWSNKVYIARPGGKITTYPDAQRRRIKQTITSCDDPTLGIPGIPVVMTKCQSSMTDGSGTATIIAHGRYNYLAAISPSTPPYGASYIPDYGSAPGNQDHLIFSQKGGCEWNDCGGCNTSMANVTVNYLDCGTPASGCATMQPDRTLCLTPLTANPNGVGIKGIQSGGKYPVAYWLHDVIGRHTAPQIRMGEFGYVFAPNLNDGAPGGAPSPFSPPYPEMALPSLQVQIPIGLTVPNVFTRITFLVGANCLFRDYFSWCADWVQYVDNTGTTNTVNPTSIRIYFQSLNEYNKQYNFETNVAWDFITRADPSQPADIAQFIMNGDGKFLPSIKGAAVTYDRFGAFFTIDYQPELAGLQNGCLFRVIRPKQNTTGVNLPYYEQCLTLDINNGTLPTGTWDIPYVDSYLLSRSIPVPLLKGQAGPISPGTIPSPAPEYTSTNQNPALLTDGYSQNNTNNNNGVVIFQTVDAQTTFPYFFESPSPSDLWGSHMMTKGRVGIPNPYEGQFRIGTEIAISNPVADKGIVNGIGVFLEKNRQIFDRNTWGDITVVLVETSTCLVICQRDHFTIDYDGNQLQIRGDTVIAQNQYGIFTSPQRKSGANYGCGMDQINTIKHYAGIVRWLDIHGYVVIHNFTTADSNTDEAGYLGYMLNKIATVNMKNLSPNVNGITYFGAGIDPKTMEYYLTTFNIPASGAPSYINTETTPVVGVNETFVFDLKTAMLKGFASFTPEYFGWIPGYYLQKQFLSFKSGLPHIHHNNFNGPTPPLYCNFYGVQCEVRITHIVNGVDGKTMAEKVKRFLAMDIYMRQSVPGPSGTMPTSILYSDAILSEKGQTSRLKVGRFIQRDGVWSGEILCALNTPTDPNIPVETSAHAILDGDPLQGRWLQVSLTSQSGWLGIYFELTSTVNYLNFVEKTAD